MTGKRHSEKEKSMKRHLIAVLVFAALAGNALAQRNPRGTAKLTVNGKAVSVEYGRPALKGRSAAELLAQLKPGDVWRLGADQSTTFSTATDLAFGDVTVPKGQYSLWTRKEANGWTLVFNKQHGQWGTNHDAGQDLAAVPLKEEKEGKSADQVTVTLEEEHGANEISIQWGDMELSTDFKAK
jgi:hypothetical protein